MDPSWWIYSLFDISDRMKAIAKEYRETNGLESDSYYALHIRSESVLKSYCGHSCDCRLEAVAKAAGMAMKERFSDHSGAFYLAWDVTTNTMKHYADEISSSKQHVEQIFSPGKLKLYQNFMDPATEIFVDILNLVEARECISFGGGAVLSAANYHRLRAEKPPCTLSNSLKKDHSNTCRFTITSEA